MAVSWVLTSLCVISVSVCQSQEIFSNATTDGFSTPTSISEVNTTNNTSTTTTKKQVCQQPSSLKERSACCLSRMKKFQGSWFEGGRYLQTFFDELRVLKCPELRDVCEEKLYASFSEYSRLVYALNCDADKFHSECKNQVAAARGVESNQSWNDVISDMSSTELKMTDLEKPCLQVALYKSKSGGHGYYHEIIDPFIPFCDISWCGFDAKTIEDRDISSWDCMPSWCRANVTIAAVVCGLLAAAIVLANVTVIVVFTTSPKLRNSQAVYKISLAIADLLVGAFVLPTFISSLTILYQSRASMGRALGKKNIEGTIARKSGGLFEQRFTNEYINFVGFFTILSLIISIYTLMMASCDRFMAIYRPLKYSQHRAKRIAIWTSLALWIAAIFYSVLPTVVPGMNYGLAASVMMAAMGTTALILYAVFVLIPLVLVWVLTILTYLSTKRHARVRATMRVRRGSQGSSSYTNMEARLAKTLATMVGVFTTCLLPAAIILIVPLGVSNIYYKNPRRFDPQASKVFISMEFVAILILMTNSLWNCFIYNARSDEFKKTAKHLYARILRALGFNALWRKTRDFANTTVRSKSSLITTVMTTRRIRKMSNDTNLNTNTNVAPHAYRHSRDRLESNPDLA